MIEQSVAVSGTHLGTFVIDIFLKEDGTYRAEALPFVDDIATKAIGMNDEQKQRLKDMQDKVATEALRFFAYIVSPDAFATNSKEA